jgi:hypothetical protein
MTRVIVRHPFCLILIVAAFAPTVLSRPGRAEAPAPQNLSILEAGVESSEDAPVVPAGYAFMAGDYVYFSFEIAGFKVVGSPDSGPRQIALSYKVEATDAKGMALAPAVTGKINDEIGREDKNWLPKRRASFLLPSYIGTGTYSIKVTVEDNASKSKINKVFEFHVGGPKIEQLGHLSVQNFRFLRDEQDGPGLEVPDYRPGDTVWARFDMCGFKTNPDNSVELQYGISVTRADGKVIFEQKVAADQKVAALFYPPQFIPGVLSVSTTSDLLHGEYTMALHVRDLIGKQSSDFQQKFRIE